MPSKRRRSRQYASKIKRPVVPAAGSKSSPQTPRCSSRLLVAFICLALGTALGYLLHHVKRSIEESGLSPVDNITLADSTDQSVSASLVKLLELDAEGLASVDIARMTLLCAADLRGGAQHIDACIKTLDRWAEHVRFETDRHLYKFHANPGEYRNSEPYYRMLMLVTVLQQDCGVRYNPARIRDIDFTNARDLFIHGMIPYDGPNAPKPGGGTCVSMPVLYIAIGRRLGYPVKLVTTHAHLFARWDGEGHANPAWRDRFNIEASGRGMAVYDDAYYMTWPKRIAKAEVEANRFLRSLSPSEELAEFLVTRGHNLLDTGRLKEAVRSYEAAVRRAPQVEIYRGFLAHARRRVRSIAAGGNAVAGTTPNAPTARHTPSLLKDVPTPRAPRQPHAIMPGHGPTSPELPHTRRPWPPTPRVDPYHPTISNLPQPYSP